MQHEPTDLVYHLLPRHVGQTLASVLRDFQSSTEGSQRLSWDQIRQQIHSRRVQVNGNICVDDARRLKLTDVLKVLARPSSPPPGVNDIRIAYIDRDLVVVDKPAGITTTRHHEESNWSERRRQIQPTLDELLPQVIAKYYQGDSAISVEPRKGPNRGDMGRKSSKVGTRFSLSGRGEPSSSYRNPVYAVHRIDRDTSGLIVFARTREAEQGLISQFKAHSTRRRYVAICSGRFPSGEQTYDSRFVRDRGDGLRGSTTDEDENVGKRAVTHATLIDYVGDSSMISCRLDSGRTHQIRIHLLEAGFPLVGDKMYRKPLGGRAIPDTSGAPRTMLHAAEIGFVHPVTGERIELSVNPPRDFLECVRRLAKEPKSDRI